MTAMARVEVLRAACCVAGADGNVDENEKKMLQQLADRVGVGKASLTAMILRAETEPEFFKKQFEVLKADAKGTMQILIEVAAADRKLDSSELGMLTHLAGRLGMERQAFEEFAKSVIESKR